MNKSKMLLMIYYKDATYWKYWKVEIMDKKLNKSINRPHNSFVNQSIGVFKINSWININIEN